MTKFLIARHAQSEWNIHRRWQGHADAPLSTHGLNQAKSAAVALAKMEKIDAVVSSDLARAHSTASIIAEALGVENVSTDVGLRERNVGTWQGLTTEEIELWHPGAIATGNYPHGWESQQTLVKRVFAALRRTADIVGPGHVLAVSHAAIIYAIENYFDRPFKRIKNLNCRYLYLESNDMRLGKRVALVQE